MIRADWCHNLRRRNPGRPGLVHSLDIVRPHARVYWGQVGELQDAACRINLS
jgi:hypothetical protein